MNVGIIDFVFDEAVKLVGERGYDHLALQIKELALQDDPKHSDTIDVRPIEDFLALRDGGAPFGGANIRVFYGIDDERRSIIPLGVIKKQNNGHTPLGDKVRMRRRWRNYWRGEYGNLPT